MFNANDVLAIVSVCLIGLMVMISQVGQATASQSPSDRIVISEDSGAKNLEKKALFSEQQAVKLALNQLTPTSKGLVLSHPAHGVLFSPNGISFRPRGSTLSWTFSLRYVGNGGPPLAEVNLDSVQPEANSDRVIYNRRKIVEEYVLGRDSIRQQFLLLSPLSLASQDLVIEGTVESEGRFESFDEGWLWRKGDAVVSLGSVFVFDANGREIPSRMVVEEERTRIIIDGKKLEQAAYPVTVDPEIGTDDFRISNFGPEGIGGFGALEPRIAYNSRNNEYLVVWGGDEDLENFGDTQIFGQRIDAATGNEVGENDFLIGSPPNPALDAIDPRVAYNSINNEYLVVWESDAANFAEFEIFGQRLDAATGAEVGADDFRISTMGPDGNPDFGADSANVVYNVTNNEYLVVWIGDDLVDGEREVYGQRLDATGAQIGTDDFRISTMGPDGNPDFDACDLDVVYNPIDNEYLVAWCGEDTGVNEFEVYGQRIDAETGDQVGVDDFRISTLTNLNPEFDAFNVSVAHNPALNEYLVVWRGEKTVEGEFEIYGQRIDSASGTQVGADDFRISTVGPENDSDFDAFDPTVEYDPINNEWLVAWEGEDIVRGEFEIYIQRLDALTGAEIGENDLRISVTGPEGNPDFDAIDAAVAYNPTQNEYLIVFQADHTVPDDIEIFGQRFAPNFQSFFAQFGDGQDLLFSQIMLMNLVADQAANVTIILKDPDGDPLSVDLNGDVVDGELEAVIPASGIRVFRTDGIGGLATGSVSVVSDQPLAGVILFGGVVGVAGVGSSQPAANGFIAPMENDVSEEIRVGVAVKNLEERLVTATLQLFDQDGNLMAERSDFAIAALGRQAQFLDELFSPANFPNLDLSNFEGLLKVSADGIIAATVLQTRPGEFATMPVAQAGLGSEELFFAQFGDGMDLLFSQIMLFNLDKEQPASVDIKLSDPEGQPLEVDLNGEVVVGELDIMIPACGIQILRTDGVGEVATGSVVATSNRPIAGVILFGGAVGVAGVGSSIPFPSSFVAPMENNTADEIRVGIAIMNLAGGPVDVTLDLFDDDGNLVSSVDENIPVMGRIAKFLDELFPPGVDLSDFTGVLRVTGNGAIAGTVIQTRPGQFATMPVVQNQ